MKNPFLGPHTYRLCAFLLAAFISVFCLRAASASPEAVSEEERLEDLIALPYLSHSDSGDHRPGGVTVHDSDKIFFGLNLVVSQGATPPYLMGMNGEVFHQWTIPDPPGEGRWLYDRGEWLYGVLDKNGDLLLLGIDLIKPIMIKISFDSKLIWASPYWQHHDMELDEKGNLNSLSEGRRLIDVDGEAVPCTDNYVLTFSPDMEPTGQVSLLDILPPQVLKRRLKKCRNRLESLGLIHKNCDLMHTNSITKLTQDIGVGKKGDFLFSMRNLSLLMIGNLETKTFRWGWGQGVLSGPHHASLLKNGNILVFDNGRYRNYSRVLEVHPPSGKIVWSYEGKPRESFYSKFAGGAHRLPNGNVLIIESFKGHVFEVTREGEIVWEMWNSDFNEKGERAHFYRMKRFSPEELSHYKLPEDLSEKLRKRGYLPPE